MATKPNAERSGQKLTAQQLTVSAATGTGSFHDVETSRLLEPNMELLSRFFSWEWQGMPAPFWILAGLLCLVIASTVPIRIIRKTQGSEFILETKPTPPEKKKLNGRRRRTR